MSSGGSAGRLCVERYANWPANGASMSQPVGGRRKSGGGRTTEPVWPARQARLTAKLEGLQAQRDALIRAMAAQPEHPAKTDITTFTKGRTIAAVLRQAPRTHATAHTASQPDVHLDDLRVRFLRL